MNLPTKTLAAALVAASFATVATPADAQWGWRGGWGWGGLGVGLAAGAIIGGAIAASSYNDGYYGYPYRRAYYGSYAPTYAYYPANYGYGYASYGYSPGYYGYAYAPGYYGGYPRIRAAVRRAYRRW